MTSCAAGWHLGGYGGQRANQGELLLAPHTDITETEKELRINAELPGVSEKDIAVELNENVLTIHAQRAIHANVRGRLPSPAPRQRGLASAIVHRSELVSRDFLHNCWTQF